MASEIEVRAYDGILYSGPASLAPGSLGPGGQSASGEDWGWSLDFQVPAERVAQFQARRGEEVELTIDGGRARAWVGDFRFESDASATGAGGTGVIQLVGRGDKPSA